MAPKKKRKKTIQHPNGQTLVQMPKKKWKIDGVSEEAIERKRYMKPLPVKASAAEIENAASEQARIHVKRRETQEAKREANAKYREEIAGYDSQLDQLADTVNKSTKLEPVECVDLLEGKMIVTVRMDKKEVVPNDDGTLSRPASEDERQMEMPTSKGEEEEDDDEEEEEEDEAGDPNADVD